MLARRTARAFVCSSCSRAAQLAKFSSTAASKADFTHAVSFERFPFFFFFFTTDAIIRRHLGGIGGFFFFASFLMNLAQYIPSPTH